MYPPHPNKPPLNLMDPFALQLSTGLPVIPNVSIQVPAPILDLSGLRIGLPELPPIDLNMPADFCEQYFDNVIDLSAKRAQAAFLNAQKVHAQVLLLRSLDKSRNVGASSSSPGYIVEMPESPKKQGSSSTVHQIEQGGQAIAFHFSITEITDDSDSPQSISSNNDGVNLNTTNNVAQPVPLDNKSSSNASRIQLLESMDSTSAQKETEKDGVVAPPKPKPVAAPPTPATGPPKEKVVVQTIGDVKKNDHAKTTSEATGKTQHPAQPQNICSKLNTNKDARVAAPTVKVSSSSDSGDKSKSFNNGAQLAPLDRKPASTATPVQLLKSINCSAQKEDKKRCVVAPPTPQPEATITRPATQLEPVKEKVVVQIVRETGENDHGTTFDYATSKVTGNARHVAPSQNSSSNDCSNMNIVAGSPMPKSMTSRTCPPTQSSETPEEKEFVQTVSEIKQNDDATTLASATSNTTDDAKHAAPPQKASSSIDCSIESPAPKVQEITSIFDDDEQIDLAIALDSMTSSLQGTLSTNDVENLKTRSHPPEYYKSKKSNSEEASKSFSDVSISAVGLLESVKSDKPSFTLDEEQKENHDASGPDGVVNPLKTAESDCGASVSSKPPGQIAARGKSKNPKKKSKSGNKVDTRAVHQAFHSTIQT